MERLKSTSTAWCTRCHPSLSAGESAVLHHTIVGEIYSMMAHCVCEREQGVNAILCAQQGSLWLLKERISSYRNTGCGRRLNALCLCVTRISIHTLRSLLTAGQLYLLFRWTSFWLFCGGVNDPDTGRWKRVVMLNVLCASALIMMQRPSVFMTHVHVCRCVVVSLSVQAWAHACLLKYTCARLCVFWTGARTSRRHLPGGLSLSAIVLLLTCYTFIFFCVCTPVPF